eukprot:3179-Heterococcus_DN1.PRE.2
MLARSSPGSTKSSTSEHDQSHAAQLGQQAAMLGVMCRELGLTVSKESELCLEIASAWSQRLDNRVIVELILKYCKVLARDGKKPVLVLAEAGRGTRVNSDTDELLQQLAKCGGGFAFAAVSHSVQSTFDKLMLTDADFNELNNSSSKLQLSQYNAWTEATSKGHADYSNRHNWSLKFLARRLMDTNKEGLQRDVLLQYYITVLAETVIRRSITCILATARVSPDTVKDTTGKKSAKGLQVQCSTVADVAELVSDAVYELTGKRVRVVRFAALDESGDSCPDTVEELPIMKAMATEQAKAKKAGEQQPQFMALPTAIDRVCRSSSLLEQLHEKTADYAEIVPVTAPKELFDGYDDAAAVLDRAIADGPAELSEVPHTDELLQAVGRVLHLCRKAPTLAGPVMLPAFIGKRAVSKDGWARVAMRKHAAFKQTFTVTKHLASVSKLCTSTIMKQARQAEGDKRGLTATVKQACGKLSLY